MSKLFLRFLVFILLVAFMSPTAARASTSDFSITVTGSDGTPYAFAEFGWQSSETNLHSTKKYISDASGTVKFQNVPPIRGYFFLAKKFALTAKVSLKEWASNIHTLGTLRSFVITQPVIQSTTVHVQLPNGNPVPNVKVIWNLTSGINRAGFQYTGKDHLRDENDAVSSGQTTTHTDAFGNSRVSDIGVIGPMISTMFWCAPRNLHVTENCAQLMYGHCLRNVDWWPGSSSFQLMRLLSERNTAVEPATEASCVGGIRDFSGIVTNELIPSRLSGTVSYVDGNQSASKTFIGDSVVILDRISSVDAEITSGVGSATSPVTISVRAGSLYLQNPMALEILGPNNESVKLCNSKPSKLRIRDDHQYTMQICPKYSGYYKVMTTGVAGAVQKLIMVPNSQPTIPRNLNLNYNSNTGLEIQMSRPEYDGGAPLLSLNWLVSCGKRKISGKTQLNNELPSISINLSSEKFLGTCLVSVNTSNRFGSSPSASETVLIRR